MLTVWGYTSNQNIKTIQLLQNRTARIITGNYDYINTRGIDLVRQLKWMTITQRRNYFTSLMMFKCVHGMAPDYLCDSITLHKDIANRITRSYDDVNKVHVPRAPIQLFKNAFAYRGPVMWNMLPKALRCCVSIGCFKKYCKVFILENTRELLTYEHELCVILF